MIDYHLHTPFCRHAGGTMEQYVEKALEKGVEEICFTPHIPLPDFPRGGHNLRMDPGEFDDYIKTLESLRSRYRDSTILCGVEADYYPTSNLFDPQTGAMTAVGHAWAAYVR